jgi:hypothetical protein
MSQTARPRPTARTLAFTAAILLALRLAGCVAIEPEDDDLMIPPPIPSVTPVPAPTVAGISDIVVVDMHEQPGSDPSLIRIIGTIVNHSNQEVSHVTVRVEARDILGRALTRVTVPALVEPIAAAGGTSSFEAAMPKSATIHDYHAEVVSK